MLYFQDFKSRIVLNLDREKLIYFASIIFSVLLHFLIILTYHFISDRQSTPLAHNSTEQSQKNTRQLPPPLQTKDQFAEKKQTILKNHKVTVKILLSLDQEKKTLFYLPQNSREEKLVPNSSDQKPFSSSLLKDTSKPLTSQEKSKAPPQSAMSKFLPSSTYFQNYRKEAIDRENSAYAPQAATNYEIPYARHHDEPIVKERYVQKDFGMGVFKEKLMRQFAQAWGATQLLPPESQFKGVVGDVYLYRIHIAKNGSIEKVVNLTALEQPERNFSEVDALFEKIVKRAFASRISFPSYFKDDEFTLTIPIAYRGMQGGDIDFPFYF